MLLKDWLTIAISCLALLVAAFGIVERRIATRRIERTRLSEIVSQINEVDLEEMQDESNSPGVGQAYNTSREILGQQALILLGDFRGRVTAAEYRTLAHALKKSGYAGEAESLWRKAVEQSRKEGPTQQLYCLRGLGLFLFNRDKHDEARSLLLEAESLTEPVDFLAQTRLVETYVWWAKHESEHNDGLLQALELLQKAQRVISSADEGPRRATLARIVAKYFDEAVLQELASRASSYTGTVSTAEADRQPS